MALFTPAENDQAFAKIGVMGFQGSGKTYTSVLLAIGLALHLKKIGIAKDIPPVFFIDTETGSSWVKPLFDRAGVPLMTNKTRAFSQLIPSIQEAEKAGAILLIDSATHFWRDLTESYAKQKRRKFLQFQDWAYLKGEKGWGGFTERFVNSNCHIVLCGRAGYEYDMTEDEDTGKKELQKTGVKMKAEGEFGFEPSLLINMVREFDMEAKEDEKPIIRTAEILKDRSTLLDGSRIKMPKFESFLPHINCLNLGGTHVGTVEGDSTGMFNEAGQNASYAEREAVLEEITGVIGKYHPGQAAKDKEKRGDLMEEAFGTRSYARVKALDIEVLKKGRGWLWKELEGCEYKFEVPDHDGDDIPMGDETAVIDGDALDKAVQDAKDKDQPDQQEAPEEDGDDDGPI